MTARVCHLIVGPAQHGVVRFAHEVAAATGGDTVVDSATELLSRLPTDGRRSHLHFTDRLFGSTAAAAAEQFVSVVQASSGPVGVTLHDIPQPSDGSAFEDRSSAYRRVADAADGVIVSSDHERHLFAEITSCGVQLDVVPLAVHTPSSPPVAGRPRRSVAAMLGFIYPGKGHTEVLDALVESGSDLGFLAVGRPSDGHDHLVTDLAAIAARAGIAFDVTGFVADADLTPLLRSVAVPVAHHRHVSASGSIATWIGAGRRPLVPRNRYTEEMEARSPGALWIHDDSTLGLRTALEEAIDRPESTWVAADVVAHPSLRQVGEMYTTLFASWSR